MPTVRKCMEHFEYLERIDMTNLSGFNIIRVRGTPNWVELDTNNGIIKITRSKEGKVYVPGDSFERYVKTADYDNHFVGLTPNFDKVYGSWFAYCSCGSPAVVVGHQVYKHGASPGNRDDGMVAGEMLVCFSLASDGKHLDGSS